MPWKGGEGQLSVRAREADERTGTHKEAELVRVEEDVVEREAQLDEGGGVWGLGRELEVADDGGCRGASQGASP